jgi:NADPH:quinone reductase
MRALLVSNYTSVDLIRLQEVPSPTVAPGYVRVRVKAAGIGFVDALKIAGLIRQRMLSRSCPVWSSPELSKRWAIT